MHYFFQNVYYWILLNINMQFTIWSIFSKNKLAIFNYLLHFSSKWRKYFFSFSSLECVHFRNKYYILFHKLSVQYAVVRSLDEISKFHLSHQFSSHQFNWRNAIHRRNVEKFLSKESFIKWLANLLGVAQVRQK